MGLDRKDVILGTIVAFIAWVLLTDYVPSLRWIPYAFVAGSLTTLLGTAFVVLTTSRGIHDGELVRTDGGGAASLGWTKSQDLWEEEKAGLKARTEYRRPIIFPEAVGFSRALDGLLDLLLRDYVTSWYRSISPRPLFQHEIDRCIRSVVLTVVARMAGRDLVEIGISKVLPIVTGHLKDFYDAERAVKGKRLDHSITESDELDTAIAGKYRNGALHPVAALAHSETTPLQQRHLRRLLVKLLPLVLPGNMKTSAAVTVLIQEIVTCAVLAPVLALFEDPDFWNQMIVNIGGPMLQDRKTVRKLRAALDQHAPVSPKTTRSTQFPRLRPHDTERQFEKFIRAIRHTATLSDARRCRSELLSQFRRDSAVEGQDATYIRRLETGKRVLDQKIASLSASGGPSKPKFSLQPTTANDDTTSRKRQASLRDVLSDAAGLSYFMEYMDRLGLMRLVQFWLVVDGFRNPLESDMDETPPEVASDPTRMDIAQMYEGYLTKPELHSSDLALRAAKEYLKADVSASPHQYISARRAVLQTQTEIYERMRKDAFENFKKSDLYYKWLAIEDNPVIAAVQSGQDSSAPPPDRPTGPLKSTSAIRRPQLAALGRDSDMRRAVLSSTDLKGVSKDVDPSAAARRSLDDVSIRPRAALFDDDVEDERMAQSASSLRSYDSDVEAAQEAQEQAKAVSAMQLALDNIVGEEDEEDSQLLFSESSSRPLVDAGEKKPSLEQARPTLATRKTELGRPNISSLGLVGVPSSRGVFVDDLFIDEAKKFPEDEREDSDAPEQSEEDAVREAAPGDLGLTEAIDALNADIERLHGQKTIVDSLTAKAELTNNTPELRILRKSEQSLQREIRRKEMQKRQYVVQESDNSLYGRAQITIKSVMVGREEDGREYALYVVEVRRQAGQNMSAATWAVTRRYSQFHELHKRLQARFPAVRGIDFPRRQALFTLQRDFLERRRQTLERYLRSLLLIPAICSSRELRAFLSQSAIISSGSGEAVDTQAEARDFVTRIYNSVSDGMEEFLGNISALDQLSMAGQNLISAATSQMNGEATASIDALDPAAQDPATAAEAEAELNAYETKEFEPFVKPICDLFLETFELSKGNSWLRGRTVVVVLHQLLGGTIERKVRETARTALEDESLVGSINMLKNIMWPDGTVRAARPPRTATEKARTLREAALLLNTLIPDLAGSVVGKSKAHAASRKIVAVLNNRRLKYDAHPFHLADPRSLTCCSTHLVFTLLDEIIGTFFPEALDK